MKEQEIEVTLFEIKNLYEFFFTIYRQPGFTFEWSKITIKNIKYLETPYNQISQGVYNEENDPKFFEFKDKYEKLVRKFADRDDQGNIVMEDEEPRITEMIVEFNKEKEELEKEYKEMLNKLENKNSLNKKFLDQKVKIKIIVPDNETDYPPQVPPYVLEILTERAVK